LNQSFQVAGLSGRLKFFIISIFFWDIHVARYKCVCVYRKEKRKKRSRRTQEERERRETHIPLRLLSAARLRLSLEGISKCRAV
jgi:hypothetical protein